MVNNELKMVLEKFISITIQIIGELKADNFNELKLLFDKRQELIDYIDKMEYSKGDFTKIANELKLLDYQKKVEELMNLKRNSVRVELEKLIKSKTANKSYNKGHNVDSLYFNKKI